MFTILEKYEAENLIHNGEEEFRIVVYPNLVNKFSFLLTGRINKGIEIFGVGPFAMKAYWSLHEYSRIVGLALDKKYRVFIKKDGIIFKEGDWFIEFNK